MFINWINIILGTFALITFTACNDDAMTNFESTRGSASQSLVDENTEANAGGDASAADETLEDAAKDIIDEGNEDDSAESQGQELEAAEGDDESQQTAEKSIKLTGERCLWPPNHKFHDFNLTELIEGDASQCSIEKITSSESEEEEDFKLGENLSFSLKAERLGAGDGRIYTVYVKCGDAESKGFKYLAPHDMSDSLIREACKGH